MGLFLKQPRKNPTKNMDSFQLNETTEYFANHRNESEINIIDKFEYFSWILNDDRDFGNLALSNIREQGQKYIETTIEKLHLIQNEFNEKLDNLVVRNGEICDENDRVHASAFTVVQDLLEKKLQNEAYDRYKEYERLFQSRTVQKPPKLILNDINLSEHFSFDQVENYKKENLNVKTEELIDEEVENKDNIEENLNIKAEKLIDEEVEDEDNIKDLEECTTKLVNGDHNIFSSPSKPSIESLIASNESVIIFYSKLCEHDVNNATSSGSLCSISIQTSQICELEWMDENILSLGHIKENLFYIFTQLGFCLLNALNGHIEYQTKLPDSYADLYDETSKRIGFVFDDYMYYIYVNKIKHTILVKCASLETSNSEDTINLTEFYPHIKKFIHFCVDKNYLTFLVLTNDDSYELIYSDHDLTKSTSVNLTNAKQPFGVVSTTIKNTNNLDETNDEKQQLWVVNDPYAKILHCITVDDGYLMSISQVGYSMCVFNSILQLTVDSDIYSLNIQDYIQSN
ncbi:unnamed protein product [Didymodactylos carnosus]|uniref:Uncharacterized protein n=1 Tax=Didymodactylos carnosus TaxID=1234261 RepID=A0A8S2DBF3_9BILA|nr:unnamed protein product [Didymodactylos carnosus]CAF3638801.1 unnamed protein product [Didymodactylos carnosus]